MALIAEIEVIGDFSDAAVFFRQHGLRVCESLLHHVFVGCGSGAALEQAAERGSA